MKPIEFKQQTSVLAKDQPEYDDLPVYINQWEYVSCWKLTTWERIKILFTGKVWNRQMNMGKFIPTTVQTENPWE